MGFNQYAEKAVTNIAKAAKNVSLGAIDYFSIPFSPIGGMAAGYVDKMDNNGYNPAFFQGKGKEDWESRLGYAARGALMPLGYKAAYAMTDFVKNSKQATMKVAKRSKNAWLPAATMAGSLAAWGLIRDNPDNYLASISPMAVLSLGAGEIARRVYENKKGMPLTWYENAIAFGFGATVGAAGYDIWEQANTIAGQLPQDVFPSQDRVDAQYVGPSITAGRMGVEIGKKIFKNSIDTHRNAKKPLQKGKNKL